MPLPAGAPRILTPPLRNILLESRGGSSCSSESAPAPAGIVEPNHETNELHQALRPLCLLGTGASSTVRLARYRRTGALYAVKATNATPGSETQLQALRELQVLREGGAMSGLTQLHEAYQIDGRIHFVLEWMAAGSLDQHLRRGDPVPVPPLAGIISQVLRGLDHLHVERRQLHRDLKPANILIDLYGAPRALPRPMFVWRFFCVANAPTLPPLICPQHTSQPASLPPSQAW
jgi:serine/threonine protein kinase